MCIDPNIVIGGFPTLFVRNIVRRLNEPALGRGRGTGDPF
jgi:hypothetical protein